jgi:hypothetical protein
MLLANNSRQAVREPAHRTSNATNQEPQRLSRVCNQAVVHSAADLARLANLLPVQLELGIRPTLPASARRCGPDPRALPQSHRRRAEDSGRDRYGRRRDGLKCIGHSRQRLRALREAVQQTAEAATIPALHEALPPPTD